MSSAQPQGSMTGSDGLASCSARNGGQRISECKLGMYVRFCRGLIERKSLVIVRMSGVRMPRGPF
jgi:hypothetical protein